MDVCTHTDLVAIGRQFDQGISPLIWAGGVVTSNDSENPLYWQEGITHEPRQATRQTQRQGRSETGSRKGASRWQGSPSRAGTTSPYSKSVHPDVLAFYSDQLSSVNASYPGTLVWYQEAGFWLLSQSDLLDGCDRKALFLTVVPYDTRKSIQCWAFWDKTIGIEWIGSRHTNFPYGSICAFDPKEGVPWGARNLVTYLDLYTLWAVKHLYFERFARWPGKQSVPHLYERVLELDGQEMCGCEADTGKLYADCCQKADMDSDILKHAIKYSMVACGGLRNPPDEIVSFALNRDNPPSMHRYM